MRGAMRHHTRFANVNSDRISAAPSSIPSYGFVVCLTGIVALIDIRVLPYLRSSGMTSSPLVDVVVCLISGSLGIRLAVANGFPIWWQKRSELRPPGHLFVTAGLGLFVILLNTGVYLSSAPTQLPAWAASLTPELALLLASRAAVEEELLYRFLLFGLIAWIARQIRVERGVSLIVGAILSSMAFTLMHGTFYIPFLESLILAVIYFESGVLPAMFVHFWADAVPFLILSIK
ncbi:MAG: type II CAAX prenyl endopeptidase Rce1 family protein [Rudaea sp.]